MTDLLHHRATRRPARVWLVGALLLATVLGQELRAQQGTELGVSEVVQQLGGKATNIRYEAVRALLPRLKEGLSGQDLNAILGEPKDSWRSNMVTVLAPKARAGLSADEAALALGATAVNYRYEAIRALIPRLKEGLSGQELHAILGDPKDSWRSNMVVVLAPKARAGLGADEAALALGATTVNYRYEAIRALTPRLKEGLSGQELNVVLGDPKDSWRSNMVVVLAPKARAGLGADEAALALGATAVNYRYEAIRALLGKIENPLSDTKLNQIVGDSRDSWRPSMIKILTDRTQTIVATGSAAIPLPPSPGVPIGGLPFPSSTAGTTPTSIDPAGAGQRAASPGGGAMPPTPSAVDRTPPSSGTAAVSVPSIDARVLRLRRIAGDQSPYLYGSTGPWSDISIVAMDLPVRFVGATDHRALYDQLYFSSLQYTGLAQRWINRAQAAKNRGDLAFASRCLDIATIQLQQGQSSYAAATAVGNKDLARATTYVRFTYETSKWAAGIVATAAGMPGGSSMVDAVAGFIDFALNAQETGVSNAFGQSVVDAVIYAVIQKVRIPGLDGRTLEEVIQNRSGKILASVGVLNGLREGIMDAGARKVVVDAAKSILALPLQSAIEGQINAALDRILAVDPSAF